jgi:hypothetical protein
MIRFMIQLLLRVASTETMIAPVSRHFHCTLVSSLRGQHGCWQRGGDPGREDTRRGVRPMQDANPGRRAGSGYSNRQSSGGRVIALADHRRRGGDNRWYPPNAATGDQAGLTAGSGSGAKMANGSAASTTSPPVTVSTNSIVRICSSVTAR